MTIVTILQIALVPAMLVLAVYCAVLSRRVRKLNNLESGLGAAIAVMSLEVDRLDTSLRAAREAAQTQSDQLELQLRRAQAMSARLDRLADAATPHRLRRRRPEAEAVNA
ncbi:hypothetical protein [Paracoccus jiaweipingae]|uniref:hypothetical protein n=1 Tax=unclassified Paracoccus (in: a-proteobacteria) TaxID=2688777 RepID=UPI0037B90867